jgi:hypothetical protein
VGRVVSRTLSRLLPRRVVVAERSADRAQAFACELGQGASGLAFDVRAGVMRAVAAAPPAT